MKGQWGGKIDRDPFRNNRGKINTFLVPNPLNFLNGFYPHNVESPILEMFIFLNYINGISSNQK